MPPSLSFLAALLSSLPLYLIASPAAIAQPEAPPIAAPVGEFRPEVIVRVIPAKGQATPGDQFAIAVLFDHLQGWHIHTNKPVVPPAMGDFTPIPTEIKIQADPGVKVGPIQWPPVHFVPVDLTGSGTPVDYGVFEGQAVAYIPLIVDPGSPPAEVSLQLTIEYQACDDTTCVAPETVTESVRLPVVASGTVAAAPPPDPAIFGAFDPGVFADMLTGTIRQEVEFPIFGWTFSIDPSGPVGLGLLMLVAALGGLLLNMTPCVLPVIPIKIMGLSQAAGNPARCLMLGILMSVGVVAFWLAIGGAIAFISGFDAISSLFQRAWFSIVVGLVIAGMGVGMLGLFTISLPQAVYMLNPSHDTAHGSFLFGMMTAVLSTPCTAPFMGSAAAWAATQSPAVTMGVFAAIGAGMALPYLLLSANPRWINRVPRTGPASELVKQVMGLFMLAVAAFFLGVGLVAVFNRPPDPPSRLYWWVVAAFVALAGGWLAYRTFGITRSGVRRALFAGVALVLAAGSVALAERLTDRGPIEWVYYTPERFEQGRAEGKVIVIDFTAEWCLNCKALEAAVLHRDDIAALLNSPEVLPMKIDLTGNNPAGKQKLAELGWVGIPLLAISGPGLDEPLKFDSYTPEMVRGAVARARAPASPGTP